MPYWNPKLSPAAGGDDGAWGTDGWWNSDAYCRIGHRQVGGSVRHAWVRFPQVYLPQGATITAAALRLTAYATDSYTGVTLRVYGNAADNAAAPTSMADADAKALTTAYVNWVCATGWTDGQVYSPGDLTAIIQEIVNRPGWASGNALMLLIKDNGSAAGHNHQFTAYDAGLPAEYAELEIHYDGEPTNVYLFQAGAQVEYDLPPALKVRQTLAQVEYSILPTGFYGFQALAQVEFTQPPPQLNGRKFPIPPTGRLLQTQPAKRKFPVVV